MPAKKKDVRIALYLKTGYGWLTPGGVHFTRDHPYQLVDPSDAPAMLAQPNKFRKASPEEIKQYYNFAEKDL